jgi:hypothetical protein
MHVHCAISVYVILLHEIETMNNKSYVYLMWQCDSLYTRTVSSDGEQRNVRRYFSLPRVTVHAYSSVYRYAPHNDVSVDGPHIRLWSHKIIILCRSQGPRGLRRRSTAARLLRTWVWIPPGAWMFVCCVLSGRGLCDELITRPESYRLCRVVVCDQETSWTRRPLPALGCSARENNNNIIL